MIQDNSIPRGKLWLFRFIAVFIIPAVLVLSLESGLRFFDYGFDTKFTVKCEEENCYFYRENLKFTYPYFSEPTARFAQPLKIDTDKKPNTYRIFVLGASAAEGYPDHTFGFARILETMLRDQYPGANIEVINTGITAINSHVVVKVAEDLASFKPDLFIVYLGNNEVVGPFGPGTALSPFEPNYLTIRLGIFLNSIRLGQLLKSLSEKLFGPKHQPLQNWDEIWNRLSEKQIRADDPRLEIVYSHYRRNLNKILEISKSSGAKVVVSTVASNLKDFAPFASLHKQELSSIDRIQWDTLYQTGIEFQKAGLCKQAIKNYLRAINIDKGFAEVHFRLGRCYQTLQDYSSAHKHYLKARDLDALRFRADTSINQIIKDAASGKTHEGIILVDATKAFRDNSPSGIPGNELFYEHVHLKFQGNYLLAKEIFLQLQPQLPSWVLNSQSSPKQIISMEKTAQNLAYTGFNQLKIIDKVLDLVQQPPYTNLMNYEEFINGLREQQESLSYYAQQNGLLESAKEHADALELNSQDKWIHFSLGRLLLELGEYQQAARHLRWALSQMPEYTPAKGFLDFAEENQPY